jgi:glutamate synthase (NADPH/NADH) small chain
VLGARTVVEAVNYSKQVANTMDEYLRSLDDKK